MLSFNVRPPPWSAASPVPVDASAVTSCAEAGIDSTSHAESAMVRRSRAKRIMASPELRDGAHHRIRGLDDLGIDFIGALGGDEIGHLAHHVDVGLLQEELLQLPEADIARIADGRRAGGLGLAEEVVAVRLQAGL